MSLDKTTVLKVASLARLQLSPDEVTMYTTALNGLLGWVEQLKAIPTDGVEPMASVVGTSTPQRADIITDGDRSSDILSNAPDGLHGFFAVPKVVE